MLWREIVFMKSIRINFYWVQILSIWHVQNAVSPGNREAHWSCNYRQIWARGEVLFLRICITYVNNKNDEKIFERRQRMSVRHIHIPQHWFKCDEKVHRGSYLFFFSRLMFLFPPIWKNIISMVHCNLNDSYRMDASVTDFDFQRVFTSQTPLIYFDSDFFI